ncbi:unnamed protein product [Calypogeia fissa]
MDLSVVCIIAVEMSELCANSKPELTGSIVNAMVIMNMEQVIVKENKVQDSTSPLDMKDKKGLNDYDCFLESLDWEALSKESWATGMVGASIVKSVIGKVDGLTGCTLSNYTITIHVGSGTSSARASSCGVSGS